MSEKMDLDLDRLMAEMAADGPAPPEIDGLMARILQDAAREQPRAAVPARPRPVVPAPSPTGPGRGAVSPAGGWFGTLAEVFGGRGALAGMMLATVTGLYLGIAQPVALTGLTAASSDTPLASLDLLSGSDSLWTEAAQ